MVKDKKEKSRTVRKRKPSEWNKFVQNVFKNNPGISFAEAIHIAKNEYVPVGSSNKSSKSVIVASGIKKKKVKAPIRKVIL